MVDNTHRYWTVGDMVTILKYFDGVDESNNNFNTTDIAKRLKRSEGACTSKYWDILRMMRKNSFKCLPVNVEATPSVGRMLKAYSVYKKSVVKPDTVDSFSRKVTPLFSGNEVTHIEKSEEVTMSEEIEYNHEGGPIELGSDRAIFVTWYCKSELKHKFKKICVPNSYDNEEKEEYVSSFLNKLSLNEENSSNLNVWDSSKLKLVKEPYVSVRFKVQI